MGGEGMNKYRKCVVGDNTGNEWWEIIQEVNGGR